MNINCESIQKNKFMTEEDINISITDEHTAQELTSKCETGKSFGIITSMNYPHLTISSNKTKSNEKNKCYSIYNKDNFSTYTNIDKTRNNNLILEDEINIEVRIY